MQNIQDLGQTLRTVSHTDTRIKLRGFAGVRFCAGVGALGLLTFGALGCASNVDPTTARAEFSSKDRSLPRQAATQPRGVGSTERRPPRSGEHIEPPTPVAASTDAAWNESTLGAGDDPILAALLADRPDTRSRSATAPDSAVPWGVGGSGGGGDPRDVLRRASASSWAALRAHAIEASARNEALLREIAPRGLVDENRGVRFVACMAIGEAAKNAPAGTRRRVGDDDDVDLCVLVRPLLNDESPSVRAAAMLALSRCGVGVDLTPIASMLHDADPEVRANAYLVLGELGNRSAVPLIRESLGRGMKLVNPIRARLVDLTAAEALVKLGDEREIEPIRAALFAPPEQSELTSVACDAIGRLQDEVSRPMLERLLGASGNSKRLPEVRLSAARALVRIGGPAGVGLAIAREYLGSTDPRVRAQTAALLGEIRSPESAAMLASLVRDADPTVQVAAAAGLQTFE